MTSSLSRAALSVIIIGLAAGCASGTARREPLGPTVTAEDIEHGGNHPIEDLLQAKAPGVLVTRAADGGISLRIRGVSSFMSNNEPLFVIDGVPVRSGPGGGLSGVNPYDIESIDVLKNPEDIGIYGIRGANGVIVIKTKRPGRVDPPLEASTSGDV
jgi:TonB-dependent SusC/RagA subfamily outer membrane receptor